MKPSSRLLRSLRLLFAIGQVLIVCFFVIFSATTLLFSEEVAMPLADIYFTDPAVSVRGAADTAENPAAELTDVRGLLSLRAITSDDRSLHLLISLLPSLLVLVIAFALCRLMWRLCRNVENGEIFSLGNLKLVRWLGIVVIIDAVAGAVLGSWIACALADYVRTRISVAGLEILSPVPVMTLIEEHVGMHLGSLVMGLLVLCLAEVFRQGLKLKQDADLTV